MLIALAPSGKGPGKVLHLYREKYFRLQRAACSREADGGAWHEALWSPTIQRNLEEARSLVVNSDGYDPLSVGRPVRCAGHVNGWSQRPDVASIGGQDVQRMLSLFPKNHRNTAPVG